LPCVRTITIEDNTAPIINPSAEDLVLECADPGNAAAIAAWELANGGAMASDICSEPIVWTFDAGVPIPTCGTASITPYTFTATDDCGNITTTTANVIIEDNTAPILTVPADELVECAAPNTISGCGDTETLVYEFTAIDACGNETSATAEYASEDTTDPVITTPAMPFAGECNGSSNAIDLISWLNSNGGAEAEDTCGDITWSNDYGTIVTDCGTTGEVVVTFTIAVA